MNRIQGPIATEIHQVGVIGGGQLAWMMLDAAQHLGLEIMVQTPQRTDPAISTPSGSGTCPQVILAEIADAQATAQLAQHCQVITFENEFVDLPALQALEAQGTCFRPSPSVLAALLDKYTQRTFLESIGLKVPNFATLAPQDNLQKMGFDFPVVIKSRRHGYDGQGTFILQDSSEVQRFWQRFTAEETDLAQRFMIEAFVPFDRELAMMAARSTTGEVSLYPVIETYQKQQVCHWAIAPIILPSHTQTQIRRLVVHLLDSLNAVGIFGIELFLTPDGQVFVNEIAPRTHNSGHLTIEACHTSQFEQHLRAVCDLPLGDPSLQVPGAVMVNLLGFETAQSDYSEKRQTLAQLPNATVHWYGKLAAKPGRKLGHVTVLLDQADRETAITMANRVESLWYPPNT
jgi:5-(carboxyamino)imidazole ribonucleotide synthase